MRLNTKTRYATRAMLDLALQADAEPVSLQQIAQRQDISYKYLEAIFGALRTAGLVQSSHGPQGGYRLTRPPAQITLRDVFEVFEGRDGFVPCASAAHDCSRASECALREVWAEFHLVTMQHLEQTTLADLARRVTACQVIPADYAI